MQRCIGEHETEPGLSRSHAFGKTVSLKGIEQQHRCGAALQQLLLLHGERGEAADLFRIPGHQCKRLVSAPLALPEPCHGLAVFGSAGQMEAADPLDGDNTAGPETRSRQLQGIAVYLPSLRILEAEPWSAGRAGVGLGMETAVGRIVVFGLALRAHCEGRHAGIGAVIGHSPDDRQAGAAVAAVGQRIAVSPVGRIGDVGQAVRAEGGVGGDIGTGCAVMAAGNLEAVHVAAPGQCCPLDGIDPGQRRRLVL